MVITHRVTYPLTKVDDKFNLSKAYCSTVLRKFRFILYCMDMYKTSMEKFISPLLEEYIKLDESWTVDEYVFYIEKNQSRILMLTLKKSTHLPCVSHDSSICATSKMHFLLGLEFCHRYTSWRTRFTAISAIPPFLRTASVYLSDLSPSLTLGPVPLGLISLRIWHSHISLRISG